MDAVDLVRDEDPHAHLAVASRDGPVAALGQELRGREDAAALGSRPPGLDGAEHVDGRLDRQ